MYQIVLCTCPDNEIAEKIATLLVSQKLAACVNLIPGVKSIYQWQGQLMSDNEVQLVIKTSTERFSQINELLNQHHPYDVPEVLALDIEQGSKEYLDWLAHSLNEK